MIGRLERHVLYSALFCNVRGIAIRAWCAGRVDREQCHGKNMPIYLDREEANVLRVYSRTAFRVSASKVGMIKHYSF